MGKDLKDTFKNKPYEGYNKLPDLMWNYRRAMMRNLKDKFMEQLKEAKRTEHEYCVKHKIEETMTIASYNDICDLVTRCKTIFEVEALARYVFDMNEIPSYEQVLFKAHDLEKVFPLQVKN